MFLRYNFTDKVPEVTQTAQGQKDKLHAVLSKVNEQLGLARWDETKWSVDGKLLLFLLFQLIGNVDI